MARGKPTSTRPSEMSQPMATVGMELTTTWGLKKVRRKVFSFHAWHQAWSSSQELMRSAVEALETWM